MNYTQYLQNGGSAEPRQFSEEEIKMIKTLQPYGEAFKQNPGGAIEMAAKELNFNLDSPAEIREFLTGLDAYARLIDDVDLINDIKKFGQESNLVAEEPMFKCGGRVRAKVKKACGGLKAKTLEKGDKIKKAGAECPCQWKKVGGRLIEVDCNGIPVAKNGAVLYAKSGIELSRYWKSQPDDLTNAIVDNIKGNNTGNYYIYQDGTVDTYKRYYNDGKVYPSYVYPVGKKITSAQDLYYDPDYPIGTKQSDILLDPYYDNNPGNRNILLMAHGYKPVPLTSQEEVESRQRDMQVKSALDPLSPDYLKTQQTINKLPSQATINWRNNFGEGKQGKFGGLTYNEALARQKEMQAAKDQGFNVDLGRWGADGKWGSQSSSEWDRYQQWKAAQGAQPEMSAGEKFVKEGYNSGRPWQDAELQNMDADQAIHLKTPDYNRWMSLNFNQTKARPYVAPASPVLNPNAPRKDIYNPAIAVTPYAQVNPIAVPARTEVGSGPITEEMYFKMHPVIKRNGGKMSYGDYLK